MRGRRVVEGDRIGSTVSVMAWRSLRNSAAFWYRSLRSFCSALSAMPSKPAGRSGRIRDAGAGGRFARCRACPAAFRESAGCSDRSTSPCTAPAPSPPSPTECAARLASPSASLPSTIATLFQPAPPPAHGPIRHPQDFRCCPPGDLLRHRFQQHVLNFHHPLHLDGGVLLGFVHYPASPATAQAERSRVNSTGQLTY